MTSTRLSIRVDLVEGGGHDLWPRPGRIFAAARTHTFGQLAVAIDDAFARWDRSHLYQFYLADGRQVSDPRWRDEDDDDGLLDGRKLTLGHLKAGEQFVYEFDFGDSWLHLCTVAARRIDPTEQVGIIPTTPLPYWGWGVMPDQYGRAWDGDDGESPTPPDPDRADLPRIGPWGHLR